jgi:predicted ATPase
VSARERPARRSDASRPKTENGTTIHDVVKRMAGGEPVDWASVPEGAREGLRAIETIARVAKAERRELVALADSSSPAGVAPMATPLDRVIGTTWGPLFLVEKIGEGSYGEVYRAHNPALQVDVALKLWYPRWTFEGGADAFLNEARTLARISHPNVLRVLGVARHDDRVGMWTELLRGETLEELIVSRGHHGAAEAALVGAELCRALAAVHGAGIVHRDLKTRNVMRVEGGRIVLMDFGSVTGADASAEGPFVVGTPLAMAPEQLRGEAVGPAADLYALGALLYRLVSGHYPVEASSMDELIERHGRRERTPLRDRCPDLAAEFVAIVERALAPDPSERFPSAGAFEQALLGFVQSQSQHGRRAAADARGGVDERLRHLPAPLTRFVGRDREQSECLALLEATRLLTLTGVAGCGKTRLGLQLAERRLAHEEAGAWFVDLAPVSDAARVTQTVARVLEVREERGRQLIDSVASHIGGKSMLLVLDNCEHVLTAASEVAIALLRDCPNLRMIATSREALGIPGEAVFTVPSLALPESDAATAIAVSASDAGRLFADCAMLSRPDFRLTDENAGAVSEICRRLDGIALAIELAAARVRVLAPEEILTKLDDRFRLLTGGSKWALPRHQTLLATLGWSYDQLTDDERGLLRRVAVFAGGWTIEAAHAVCAEGGDSIAVLDLLTRLVDKSLVVVERGEGAGSRYRLLETVRQFAIEKWMESGEGAGMRDRHLEYFGDLITRLAGDLRGGESFAKALAACEAEHENVLAALAWCDHSARGAEIALRIVGSILPYWTSRALFSLGLDHVMRALQRPGAEAISFDRGRAEFAASNLAFYRGDYAQCRAHGEAALDLFRRVDFKEGAVWALNAIANSRMIEGDFEASRTLYEESLSVSRSIGYTRGMAIALNNLANLACESDDPAAALPLFLESVELSRRQGPVMALGLNLANVAETCVRLGRCDEGRAPLIESLEIFQRIQRQDYGSHAISVAGLIAEAAGAGAVSARILGGAEVLREGIGVPLQPAERKNQDAVIARLRAMLGEAPFTAAWNEGRGHSFDQSLEESLAWLRQAPGAA